jgi:hypothetical protein
MMNSEASGKLWSSVAGAAGGILWVGRSDGCTFFQSTAAEENEKREGQISPRHKATDIHYSTRNHPDFGGRNGMTMNMGIHPTHSDFFWPSGQLQAMQ